MVEGRELVARHLLRPPAIVQASSKATSKLSEVVLGELCRTSMLSLGCCLRRLLESGEKMAYL